MLDPETNPSILERRRDAYRLLLQVTASLDSSVQLEERSSLEEKLSRPQQLPSQRSSSSSGLKAFYRLRLPTYVVADIKTLAAKLRSKGGRPISLDKTPSFPRLPSNAFESSPLDFFPQEHLETSCVNTLADCFSSAFVPPTAAFQSVKEVQDIASHSRTVVQALAFAEQLRLVVSKVLAHIVSTSEVPMEGSLATMALDFLKVISDVSHTALQASLFNATQATCSLRTAFLKRLDPSLKDSVKCELRSSHLLSADLFPPSAVKAAKEKIEELRSVKGSDAILKAVGSVPPSSSASKPKDNRQSSSGSYQKRKFQQSNQGGGFKSQGGDFNKSSDTNFKQSSGYSKGGFQQGKQNSKWNKSSKGKWSNKNNKGPRDNPSRR
jgi:hypothetical protein